MMENVVLLLLLCALLQQARSQTCGAGSTDCTCYGTDPTTKKSVVFNISTALTYPYTVTGADSGYDYRYSPCVPKSCGLTGVPTQANVCQFSTRPPAAEYNAGASPVWSIVNATNFVITYKFTTGITLRTTVVTFVVAAVPQASVSIATEKSATYYFTVTLPSGGGGGGGGGGTSGDVSGWVGLIFITIIILAIATYLVVGGIYMFKVKGARGLKMIPNIAFWKDLPFLIKDGVMFLFSPICRRQGGYTKM